MSDVLTALLLAGLMGILGQGARAIVGLKGMSDEADGPDGRETFRAARLLVSLMIGFIAGLAAAFLIGLDKITAVTTSNFQVLLGLAAAGYTGTDIIEGFLSGYLPGKTVSRVASANTPDISTAAASDTISDTAALSAKIETISGQVADVHSTVTTLLSSGDGGIPGTIYPVWSLTRDLKIAQSKYWEYILDGAHNYELPLSVIVAIGSKESQWGLSRYLRPPGPSGTGDWTPRNPAKWGTAMPTDGKGWGRGLMQIDWYSNDFAKNGDWQDARANILYGCELLAKKIKKFSDKGNDADTARRCGVSDYNGMSGPHSTYANDVMARADWVHKRLDNLIPQTSRELTA